MFIEIVSQAGQTDHHLQTDHLDLIACRYEMLCRIYTVFLSNPGTPVLDHADCDTSPVAT